MTDFDLDTHDKLMAASHEAGHATVMAATGRDCRCWITRHEQCRDPFREMTWTGQTQCLSSVDPTTSQIVWSQPGAVFAVAGAVADHLALDDGMTARAILKYWQREEETFLSPSDYSQCPDDWRGRRDAVEEALRILRQNARLFERIRDELLEHHLVTDGMLRV